jgi:large subunit ribosomal protein L22
MVGESMGLLQFSIQKQVARDIYKLIKSAVANLQSRHADTAVDIDALRVKQIRVDEGPQMKRFRPRAHGRVGKILKKMCHISVTLSN